MKPLDLETSLLISRYADGELDAVTSAQVEEILAEDPQAAAFLANLRQIAIATRTPVEAALSHARFDGLMAGIWAQVDAPALATAPATVARNAELEMLAMAMADGETLSQGDRRRVETYLAAQPAAQDAFLGLGELREAVRAPIERAMDRVDFDALSARIAAAVAQEAAAVERTVTAPAARSVSVWARLTAFFGAHRAVFLSVATAAVTAAVLVPVLRDNPADVGAPTVINNYYIAPHPTVESVSYERGFWGGYQAGSDDNTYAPVIWIAPDEQLDGSDAADILGKPL